MPKNKYTKVICLREYDYGSNWLKVGNQYDCIIDGKDLLTIYIDNEKVGCLHPTWFITLAEFREQRIKNIFND